VGVAYDGLGVVELPVVFKVVFSRTLESCFVQKRISAEAVEFCYRGKYAFTCHIGEGHGTSVWPPSYKVGQASAVASPMEVGRPDLSVERLVLKEDKPYHHMFPATPLPRARGFHNQRRVS